jgi:hypothetical protein
VHAVLPMAEAARALDAFRERAVAGKILLFTPRYTAEFGGAAALAAKAKPRL